MKLQYYGHSCFKLIANQGYTVVFDPYANESVPGLKLPKLHANKVICSHQHADHNAEDLIAIDTSTTNPFEITQITVPHDDKEGSFRGMNKISILIGEGKKIVHFGDIGRMLTSEEVDALQNIDLCMIPCGGYYTIDATITKQIIDVLNPKCTVLMHYRHDKVGYDEIASIDDIAKTIRFNVLNTSELTVGEVSGVVTMTIHS